MFPVINNDWQNVEDFEYVNDHGSCNLREINVSLPDKSKYAESGISLGEDRPQTYEFCRYLAHEYRDLVLCTESERKINLAPQMELILQLDEWHHPDISDGELPSTSETFKRIAKVISTGRPDAYKITKEPNTHWKNWPEGGTL